MNTPRCPECHAVLDDYMSLYRAARPKAGDVSICMYCHAVNLFTGRGREVRRPTLAELQDLRTSADWPKVQRALAELVKAKGRQQS